MRQNRTLNTLGLFFGAGVCGFLYGLAMVQPPPAWVPIKVVSVGRGVTVSEAPRVPEAPPALENSLGWAVLVERVGATTGVGTSNWELAETITLALEDASVEFGVDVWLVAHLVRVESSGNPEAVSRVGAVGLTQILPSTAVEIAGALGLETYDLRDPATNIRMGSYYLGQLLERFGGDPEVALAAYNWGPTAIARKIRLGHPLPREYALKILARL